ncbi:MAG: xanthine dehydrogenase family protein subunit M [Planctomycetes bacterium]|nr:xanthine dehydrogenase family protein subunit M [Planctomycetota bacterium]
MRPFDYVEPRSVDEAVALLSRGGERTRLLAGGTDLIPRLRRRQWRIDRLIGLRRIDGLRDLTLEDGVLAIGAGVTLEELAASTTVSDVCPLLAEAARLMASPQVRALATIGGNLCHASPAADLAPPLLCLNATLRAIGPSGGRDIPIGEFFTGPGRSALRDGELLVQVRVPAVEGRGVYLKFSPRRAMDLAVVGVACFRSHGVATVAVGAAAPTPLRVPASPDEAAARCSPIDDLRASAEYRREMVRVLTRRALEIVP